MIALPPELGELANLKILNIFDNKLPNLPKEIGRLTNLQTFFLREYKLTELPAEICNLRELKKFMIDINPLERPPLEVAVKGMEAIRKYFRQIEAEGTDQLFEAKLLIVGEPGAGKTSFANKIIDPQYQLREDEGSTQGIDVHTWEFKQDNDRTFRVNLWDFGGQEIYKATHQFFLTKRSLYALVADSRKEDTDFYYWLNVVELLSDNSPLLIILNEKQDRRREIGEPQLRGDSPISGRS